MICWMCYRATLAKSCSTASVRDSIVQNMLLHSRQFSGEHRSVDLNALVEESLSLCYHGARAEKGDFNITLQRSFDPATGEVNLLPQEITRVLLNLISNSFYATARRKAEANGGIYEPILYAPAGEVLLRRFEAAAGKGDMIDRAPWGGGEVRSTAEAG